MRRWWRARSRGTLKDLDDDHTTAATGTWQRWIWQRNVANRWWCGYSEQLPSTRDVDFAASAGEEAVVTDAVEALRQKVEQEAADEFVRRGVRRPPEKLSEAPHEPDIITLRILPAGRASPCLHGPGNLLYRHLVFSLS
jgi:hypothetical protein